MVSSVAIASRYMASIIFLTLLTGLSLSSELKQVFRLDLEQAALDRGRTTQPP